MNYSDIRKYDGMLFVPVYGRIALADTLETMRSISALAFNDPDLQWIGFGQTFKHAEEEEINDHQNHICHYRNTLVHRGDKIGSTMETPWFNTLYFKSMTRDSFEKFASGLDRINTLLEQQEIIAVLSTPASVQESITYSARGSVKKILLNSMYGRLGSKVTTYMGP